MKIPEGSNIDVNQLQSLFASKDAVSNLEKRIKACETTDLSHDERISALEKEFERMGSETNSKI